MINELYSLSNELDKKGIALQEWHREYKLIPTASEKTPCIRIWINPTGEVEDFDTIPSEVAVKLRKYGDNQKSFPAFNMVSLFRITDEREINRIKAVKSDKKADLNEIRGFCHTDNWVEKKRAQLARNLKTMPVELKKIIQRQTEEGNEFLELACALESNGDQADKIFRNSLEECIFEKLASQEEIDLCLYLLIYSGSADKEPENDVGSNISVILDTTEWRKYGEPIASPEATYLLNRILLKNTEQELNEKKSDAISDAFGTSFTNPKEPMPKIKLPGIEVTLRSMFSGQPCQDRYGKFDDESYPISPENRTKIKQALEWLSEKSKKGINWEKIDQDEILFVYPTRLPEVDVFFASLFSPQEDDEGQEAAFEAVSKNFIRTVYGIPTDQQADTVEVFALRKMDKARTKVIYTHNTTSGQMCAAAQQWSDSCEKNMPEIERCSLKAPYPLEIPAYINKVWKQDGSKVKCTLTVKRMKYYQGISLFLESLSEGYIKEYIHNLLENSEPLIRMAGNTIHSQTLPKGKTEIAAEESLIQEMEKAISAMGVLLTKSGKKKENFMEELPYLIGQMLHVADELHLYYCKVKRDGDIPPQLVGNSLFSYAADMPFQSLSQLASRTNPYIAWAKQYRCQNKEFSNLVGWYLYQYEQTANKIAPLMNRNVRFGDYEKAELFVGYLASLPSKKENNEKEENEYEQ